MKKILAVLMATLMFLTLLMPISVFAENGPAPIDWEEWANIDTESLDITDLDVSFITVIDYEKENDDSDRHSVRCFTAFCRRIYHYRLLASLPKCHQQLQRWPSG